MAVLRQGHLRPRNGQQWLRRRQQAQAAGVDRRGEGRRRALPHRRRGRQGGRNAAILRQRHRHDGRGSREVHRAGRVLRRERLHRQIRRRAERRRGHEDHRPLRPGLLQRVHGLRQGRNRNQELYRRPGRALDEHRRHGVRPRAVGSHGARHDDHAAHRRGGQGVPRRLESARDARKALRVHARADLFKRGQAAEGGQGGRGVQGGRQASRAGADQRHESAVDAPSERLHRRGLQGILPQGLPRLRGTAVLDPSERRISVQPEGHPLLPEDPQRIYRQRRRRQAVQQSGVRRRQHQGSHPRIPVAAQGRNRLPRPATERVALVLAKRRLRQEDVGLHHPQGGRPAGQRVQQPSRRLPALLGRHPSIRQVRLHPR